MQNDRHSQMLKIADRAPVWFCLEGGENLKEKVSQARKSKKRASQRRKHPRRKSPIAINRILGGGTPPPPNREP